MVFVPIIYSSTEKLHSGKCTAENRKLSSCGKILLSLHSLLKLRESVGGYFSLSGKCKYQYISSKGLCDTNDAND